jgi:alkanesulfonate monooxygenase SsuD/methylene tetrahydromethanopterin reductase-like flavin-dependent oxidoreductase (luciferase family)
MDIGIGLPTTLDVDGPTMRAWAVRAEERGFSSLASVDRIVFPNYDTLTALTFAAGATSRIGVATNVVLGPLYPPVWLAKATASIHALSGGRLTLGLGIGGRGDDFEVMGRPMNRRGKLMDEALAVLTRAWSGDHFDGAFPIVPAAARPVPILVGGNADAALARVVKYGAGWTGGGGGPQMTAAMAGKVGHAWSDAGREGQPRICALAYFGLGDDAATDASLRKYYHFLGQYEDMVVQGALRTPEAIRSAVTAFEEAGATELVLSPTVPSVDQVDRLADIVF